MITRNFNLNLYAGNSSPLVINVNQYDNGEQWVFTLYDENGVQYTPSTGAIVGIKSDGLGIINTGSVVDGKVVINETQQMTAAIGKATFELTIDSQTHGTANFVVLVEPKPGDNASLSESDLSLIQEALNATSPLPTGGTVGQVLTKTPNGSAWSDAGTPTQEQVAEAVSDWADENITVTTGVVIDTSLAVAGAAADSKKVGDEISDLKSQITLNGGIPRSVKLAMDTLFQNMAVKDDAVYSDEYATFHAWASAINLLSISAVFEQGSNVIYDIASLDDLKQYLTVTASYDDGTSSVVSGYTLSGELTVGTSQINVSLEGKTTSFSVTVSDHKERMHYSFADGDLIKVNGGGNAITNYQLFIDTSQSAKRRSFVLPYGEVPFKLGSATGDDSEYYPIPIPTSANSVTISITPTTQFWAIKAVTFDGEKYPEFLDSGWKQGSATIDLSDKDYRYIAISTKYNSSGTSYPTEPTDFDITFS